MASQLSLLNLYSQQAKWRELISLYHHMRINGFQPNTFSFPFLLRSCPLHQGQSIHADAAKRGFEADGYVTNAVVAFYLRHGSLRDALQVFDEMPDQNPVSWNAAISGFFHAGDCNRAHQLFERMPWPNVITWSAVIAGYTQNARPSDALVVFKRMRRECGGIDEMGFHVVPNSNTIASVLHACVQLRDVGFGEQVHGYTIKMSTYTETNVFVGSVLIDMYGRCGRTGLAKLVFDSMQEKCVVAWSALIAMYVHNNCPSSAIDVLREMIYSSSSPNYVTLTTVLTACAHMPNLLFGKALHGYIVKRQGGADVFVSTALIDMYSKCDHVVYAHRVFERDNVFMGRNATPMWNALITGYLENNCVDDAWCAVQSMCRFSNGGPRPNAVTMAIVLPMCARSASLLYGKEAHCYMLKNGLDEEILVSNGLLDMYSKCGKIRWAERVFDQMATKNRISWTSMIDGYGTHGDGVSAIRIFQQMVKEKNIEPDNVTFVALISACSHAGLVEEGLRYFKTMRQEYGIVPMEENYGCVVDLLARAGRINEAKDIIASMPMKPSASVWGALLGACRIHGHVEEAELVGQFLHELEPNEAGFRTLLSNIYAENGWLDGAADVRRVMRETGVAKRRGCSWLEA
ncbi:pentatricopeptide repeat-containing protein At2g13600-like [Magnolia sinica]|uniref:pentatricopeptide repeat-containing protein At2g13600-like n=1 Tax=Magnolia sinica TaxID=86752 RepID=UPI002657DEF3|nr:pentatricopeptide repeat-containing protein At2g13600-like [Magnolia sinica]